MSSRTVRSTLVVIALPLAVATSAHALPGDPPVVPLAPADAAVVGANAAGIGVSFQCPDYRIAVYGSGGTQVTDPGHFGNYRVRFSDGPALGADGRLASSPYGNDAVPSPAPGGTCTAKLDTFDTARSPEIAGGRVYWQAFRYCNGCTPQYETGAVRSFVVRPSTTGRLRTPPRVYGGYPAVFAVESPARLSGADVVLQRRAGGGWRTLVRRPFHVDRTELVASLPAGRQQIRALVVTGATQFPLAVRTVAVIRRARRSTSTRDDGRYRARSGPDLTFSVSGGGLRLRSFKASVTVFCVGPTSADNRTEIAFATLDAVRVAPDGSVTGYLQTAGGAAVTLTGTLHRRRFKGEVSMAFSTCAGKRRLDAARR